MIDTVTLKIEAANYDNSGQSRWQVNNKELFTYCDVENTYGKNWHRWNKADKTKPQGYFPHVEIWNYNLKFCGTYALYVRFSIPKLLYGNNLFEVQDQQFNEACTVLRDKLATMGVTVSLAAIQQAEVLQVHYGKNIACYGVPVSLILKRLATAKPPVGRMDVQKVSYRNADQVTFHNRIREVCFYDKYQELLQDGFARKKLAWLFSRPDLKNLLRMEVRLNKREAFNKFFGGRSNVHFLDVFKKSIAQSVVIHYWKSIYNSVKTVDFGSPEYMLEMLSSQQHLSLEVCLRAVALNALVCSVGYANTRQMLLRHSQKSVQIANWFRALEKRLQPVIPSEYDFLAMLNNELIQFKLLGKYSWGARRRLLLNAAPLFAEKLLTPAEAAKFAKVSERSLQKKLQSGVISCLRIGKLYRLRKEDFRALISCICRP